VSEWHVQIAEATETHRECRARKFEGTAVARRNAVRFQGLGEESAKHASKWFDSRAKGQRERIERVEACSIDTLAIRCQECGLEHERPARCGCRLLCVRCRGAKAQQTRVRFVRAREAVLADAAARGLLRAIRRGGAWSEKLLTLTTPRLPGDTIPGRITRVLDAWKGFVRPLQAWQREHQVPSLEFFRVLEWTCGDDGCGHPHLHVWLFSPFLDRDVVVEWWRNALQHAAGTVIDTQPIVDIRKADFHVEQELIKYLTKDIDEHGHKIAPELYAQVYCALDCRRSLQASRGFMQMADISQQRCKCGSTLRRLVVRKSTHSIATNRTSVE